MGVWPHGMAAIGKVPNRRVQASSAALREGPVAPEWKMGADLGAGRATAFARTWWLYPRLRQS